MIPRRIEGANVVFHAPSEWDAKTYGTCLELHARRRGNTIETAWEPTPAELELLARGGSLVLSIVGVQPPVALYVLPPPVEEPPPALPVREGV